MTTTKQLVTALQNATETMIGRSLDESEQRRLIQIFNQGSGADVDRAMRTIETFAELSRDEIMNRVAESDQAETVLMELEQTIQDWRPAS